MDIYLVQMAIARGKPSLNRAKVLALTASIPAGKKPLIVLPELFSTGFLDLTALDENKAAEWEQIAKEDANFLSELAKRQEAWVVGTSVVKIPAGNLDENSVNPRFQNLSLIYAPDGQEASRYQKIHPFSYGGEDRLFGRGNLTVTMEIPWKNPNTLQVESWIVQPTICYDLRFPELYRKGSQSGTHLILVQANWPEARQSHWETLLKARAIENQAYVVGANCTGDQDALHFAGGSMIISPKGEVLSHAQKEEALLIGHLDLDYCKQWRKQFPALRDRQSDEFYLI